MHPYPASALWTPACWSWAWRPGCAAPTAPADPSQAISPDTLLKFGFAAGTYGADPSDGLVLRDCRIANAVRCVPPANLPLPAEVATCNRFLSAELAAMPSLRMVLSLGVLAHAAMLRANGLPASRLRFRHGETHTLPDGLKLTNSYHVSRYNTSTRRLTPLMFEEVVQAIRSDLDGGVDQPA
jgi:hypothetical protein